VKLGGTEWIGIQQLGLLSCLLCPSIHGHCLHGPTGAGTRSGARGLKAVKSLRTSESPLFVEQLDAPGGRRASLEPRQQNVVMPALKVRD
jgi:hypothetical protein